MLFYIIGHNGWIGQLIINYCKKINIDITYSNYRGESLEILNDILNKKPTHVICCSGRTHGFLNGKEYKTIDYLENIETLQQNLNDNLYVPIKLANFCDSNNIHFTYVGTGCIYNYNDAHPLPYTEDDIPNFFGSNYSIVKGFTNELIKSTRALHLRIRMPITSQISQRNFITKITNYEKICSIPNSMSVLDELIPIAIHMMIENIRGTYNLTNPGIIEHNDILKIYKEIVDNNFTWENFSIDEQDKILLSKRSNNHLDTTKLEDIFIKLKDKYDYLKLNNINTSIINVLHKYNKDL
jgi:dTDP-4-dehydrorhamnose reductase